ncbi:MAG: CoA transferase [Dehalococcoidia bacterium]
MGKQALDGIKVLDFTWVIAGPLVTKCLADYGAKVVRVETITRPCFTRSSAPFRNGNGPDNSAYFAYYNPNKYSVALNLKSPIGLKVAKKLADWADIVVTNYVPGKMKKLGLDYDTVKLTNPDVIMLNTSGFGETGPMAPMPTSGNVLVALTGFNSFSGWPGRDCVQPYGPVNDFVTPYFCLAAIMAALRYRRETGEGQFIDVSQLEAGIQFLVPGMLDYTANGRLPANAGNTSPNAAPHAVYHCKDNRWCAIAVCSDDEWRSFCTAAGMPGMVEDPRFDTLDNRKRNEQELDHLVGQWTITRTPESIMTLLQAAGVQAGIVESAADVCQDPQLKARNHFWLMQHPVIGDCLHLGEAAILSQTPAQPRMPAPCLGEHTELIATEILAVPEDELVALLTHEGS